MKILIISQVPTHKTNSGNRSCILSYSKLLIKSGHDVKFLHLKKFTTSNIDSKSTINFWGTNYNEIKLGITYNFKILFYRFLAFKIFRSNHIKVDHYYPSQIKNKVTRVVNKIDPDIIIINYIWLSKLFTLKFNSSFKKLLYTHDVFTDKYEKTGFRWFSTSKEEEARALNRCDTVLAIQEEEARFLKSITKSQTNLITTYSPIKQKPPQLVTAKNLLFLSSSNEFNVEGINWFIEKIFPQLLKKDNEIKLLIGGSICSKLKFEHKNIIYQGFIDNLEEFYSQGNIVINPVRNGTGLKIKTLEAISFSKAIVMDAHNIIGLPYQDDLKKFIAKNNNEFIFKLLELITDNNKLLQQMEISKSYAEKYQSLVNSRFNMSIELP